MVEFSSTGNSLYIAEQIKAELGGKIRYIPKFTGDVNENTTIPLYIVLNHGGMEAFAPYYAYQVCKEKGLNIRSVQAMMMPEIYTLTFSQPNFLRKLVLRKAPKRLKPIIENIRDDKEIVVPEPKKDKWTPKHLENRKLWHMLAKDFSITDACTDCKKCIRICPTNNITHENGRIVFGDKCVACLSCYHRCPEKAVVYLDKRKKDRYLNPLIQEKNIGADQLYE